MTPTMEPVNQRPSRDFDLDPFADMAGCASRLQGLGQDSGAGTSACVFQTAALHFPTGPVTLTVKIEGFEDQLAIMFLSLTNCAAVPGSTPIRLQLVAVELHSELETTQQYQVTFDADDAIAYQLSGHIHGETPLSATRLAVSANTRPIAPDLALWAMRSIAVAPDLDGVETERTAPRIYNEGAPSLEQLFSQPCTPEQVAHPMFSPLAERLHASPDRASAAHWPEVFAYRVFETMRTAKGRAIGFDAAIPGLWKSLLADGWNVVVADRTFDPNESVDLAQLRAEVLAHHRLGRKLSERLQLTAMGEALPPDYCEQFDFAWWITRKHSDWQSITRGITNVAKSMSDGGVGVAVFPIAFGTDLPTEMISVERDLPRILIELISLGFAVVQVRMPSAGVLHKASGFFGLIVQR